MSNRKKRKSWKHNAGQFSTSIALLVCSTLALAADVSGEQSAATAGDDSDVLEEVVVTAQRVTQRLQDVPVAVTALTNADLEKAGVFRLTDLDSRVPNLRVNRNQGLTNVYIRGIGNVFLNLGGDANVAVHQDGVYVARPRAQATAFLDVERIEVLRGPQGTLYGRNATGGSINVISRRPTEVLEGDARVSFGNYNLMRFEGGIGGPVSDTVSARLAIMAADHEGYGHNIVTGREIDDLSEHAFRLSMRFAPSDTFEYVVTGDRYFQKDGGNPWHYLGQGRDDTIPSGITMGGIVAPDIRDVAYGEDSYRRIVIEGVAGTGTWNLTDELALKSITAWRQSESFMTSDVDGTSINLLRADHDEEARQISQEFQATYQDDALTFVGGLFFFDEEVSGSTKVPLLFIDPTGALFAGSGPAEGDTRAYAAYSQLSYGFENGLTITGALRYSREKRNASGTSGGVPLPDYAVGERTWTATTPRIAIDYKFSDDMMVYASYSEGFKSGAFLIGARNAPVEPEDVSAYEVGMKSVLVEDRLRLNVSAFDYDYTDLQVSRTVNNSTLTENAASSHIKGVELEATALPWEGGRLDLSAAWLDAKFDSFSSQDNAHPELGTIDLSGYDLPYSPEFAYSVRAEQSVDLGGDYTLVATAEYIWTDDLFHDPFNRPERGQDAHGIVNARLAIQMPNPNWSVEIWGKNLADKTVKTTTVVSAGAVGFPLFGSLNEPRTVGIDFAASF